MIASSFLPFSTDWMTAVWRPGSVATSWSHLACLPAVKKAKGEFDDSVLGVDWTVGLVRSENDGSGSSPILWMELALYFAAISPRGMCLGNTAHLSITTSSFQVLQSPEEFQYRFLWHVHICWWVSPKLTKAESGQGSGGGKDKQESQLNIPAKFCWSCVAGCVIQVPWHLLVGCKNTGV